MARIPLGSSQRNVSDEYKAKLYVRIAMLYLEDDDEVSADSYVARSHSIVGKADFTNLEVEQSKSDIFIDDPDSDESCAGFDPQVKFQHQACRARIFDAKRNFQAAARHYYELSQVHPAHALLDRRPGFCSAVSLHLTASRCRWARRPSSPSWGNPQSLFVIPFCWRMNLDRCAHP